MPLGWSVLIISEKIIVIRINYDKNGCSSLKMVLFLKYQSNFEQIISQHSADIDISLNVYLHFQRDLYQKYSFYNSTEIKLINN